MKHKFTQPQRQAILCVAIYGNKACISNVTWSKLKQLGLMEHGPSLTNEGWKAFHELKDSKVLRMYCST